MEDGSRHSRAFTLWFTGPSEAGKTTISELVEKELSARFGKVEVMGPRIPSLAGERAEGLLGVV